ncbi:hypothetical protein BGZ49_006573, partial [Haplosporangium sp. Z 27]
AHTARNRSPSIADDESISSLASPSKSEDENMDTPGTSSRPSAAAAIEASSLSITEVEQDLQVANISPFPDLVAKLYEI